MSTHYQGTKNEEAALTALISLMRANTAVTNAIHGHLRDESLTLPQFGVMEALFHLGPLRQRELAAKLLCTAGNMTGVVTKLEELGYVKRRGEKGDKRCNLVELTARGRKLMEKIFPKHARVVASTFAALSMEEQNALHELCKKLGMSAVTAAALSRD